MDIKHSINSHTSQIKKVVRALLREVVRFAFRHGVLFPELQVLLRSVLLEIAQGELIKLQEQPNVSRLSVLTGLSRRDIRGLLGKPIEEEGAVNLLSRVIGQWVEHPDFSIAPGKPRQLSVKGDDSEFADLVRSVSADMSPYTVLFGLQQAKAVELGSDTIRLSKTAYVPRGDLAAGSIMLGQDCADLISSVEHNLFSKDAVPNLHLTTVYENVASEKLDQIREWILDRGTSFQEEVRDFIGKLDLDTNPRLHGKEGGGRVVVSSFSLVEQPMVREKIHVVK